MSIRSWVRIVGFVTIVAVNSMKLTAAPETSTSWLACVRDLSFPVDNTMSENAMGGARKRTLQLVFRLDNKARPVLIGGEAPPRTFSFPLLVASQLVEWQVYKPECAGKKFSLSFTIVLVDEFAGRQVSRIRGDNSVELIFHEGIEK
jgi:hypothetical protein